MTARGRALPIAVSLLLACGPAPDEKLDVVRVGYQRYVSYAPIFLAEAEGYFAAHGLKVELALLPDGNAGTPLVVAGGIDVLAGPGSPGILNAITRGANVRLVADKGSIPDTGCSPMALVARPGVRLVSGSVKTVSPGRATAALEYFAERALDAAGINLAQLELHHVPPSAHIEALGRGSIDLVATTEPAVSRLVNAGNSLVRDAREVVPGLTYGFLVYGDRLMRVDRKLGERFMLAYLDGIHAYGEGKTERNVAIVAAATGDDPSLLLKSCWAPFHTGAIDTSAFGAFQDWALKRALIDRRVAASEYWDGSFLASAGTRLDHGHPPRQQR